MMLKPLLLAASLALAVPAIAQNAAPGGAPPSGAPLAGIQGQNILDVKPEVKRDASSDANYLKQTNGQRNRVQPGNNAPMWRGVVSGQAGTTSLPPSEAPEAGVLIQGPVHYPGSRTTTAGEAWRQVRNDWIIPYGGALFAIFLGALAIFYVARGPIGHSENPAGLAAIERFTPFERSAHWANAIAFVCLAMSGLVMAFGRFLLLPIMGGALYGWLAYLLKNLHNFMGPLFTVSLAIVFFTFVRDNFPQRGDLRWLLRAGGAFSRSGDEPPSFRFNAGEKVIFWGGVLVLGLVSVGSGWVMDKLVPNLVYERGTMQVAHMVHAVAGVLIMCVFAIHIYIGTIGMRGAYRAMRSGWVDESWAREHHAYWYDEIAAGRIPAQRSSDTAAPHVDAARPA
jgi:formate dehydrogenase subunit gamma